MDVQYISSGSLNVVFHEADLLALEKRLHWQRQQGVEGELLNAESLQRLEPGLSTEAKAAVYYPEEAHIYAPQYVKALAKACMHEGVTIREGFKVTEVKDSAGLPVIQGWCERERIRLAYDYTVICTGAWSSQFAAEAGFDIPIYPIRGQICAYDIKGDMPVRHMIFSSQGYVVAKANGTLVAGASEDIAGFQTTVTEKGIQRLQRWSTKLIPQLGKLQPFHRWAGLRPATQDGYPLIGFLPELPQVMMAAGHYRNGILLSPVTARLVSQLIEGEARCIGIQSFRPERFDRPLSVLI